MARWMGQGVTRTWPIDYLDGWRTDIDEQEDGSLVVIVTGDLGRTWRAVRNEIEEAIGVAWRITTEQSLIAAIIDPAMDYPGRIE
jgi:hypothetical protein